MTINLLRKCIRAANSKGCFYWLPDKPFLHLIYWACVGKRLNLKNPQTYNEKLQWLKLYNRKPEYTTMVDKYSVKQYVADKIGSDHVVPTLGVWDRFEDIDFDALPDQFVLKCTHDSGGVVVVPDKAAMDVAAAKKKLEKSLKTNYYYRSREWPYKHVKPRILAESYLEDTKLGELRDYKWYCFHGVPKLMAIFCGRSVGATTADFFDCAFRHLDLTRSYANAATPPEKPDTFEKMREFAAVLSKDIPCLRVDFYEVNGKVYVGELTFFAGSGLVAFEPQVWDERMGAWIELPM